MATTIHSNGSRWAGEKPASIDELLDVLAAHPLDPTFEQYGNFINTRGQLVPATTGQPLYPDSPGMVRFWGNFANLSHVFSIDTDEPEDRDRLWDAIRKNQLTDEYQRLRNGLFPWIPAWLEIGHKNAWIRCASDPPFNPQSFAPCNSATELADRILDGTNWSLGQAFFWRNICLIKQVNGGDEWLVIRDDVPFESFTCGAMGRARLVGLLHAILESSNEQCKRLEYAANTPEVFA